MMKAIINGVEYTRVERVEIYGDFRLIHTYAKGPDGVQILVKYARRVKSQVAFEKALKLKLV